MLDPQTEQIRRGDTDTNAGQTYRIFVRGVGPGQKPQQVVVGNELFKSCEENLTIKGIIWEGPQ